MFFAQNYPLSSLLFINTTVVQILNIRPLFKLSQLPLPCSPFPPAPSCHSFGTQSLPCIQSASHWHTSLTNQWFSVTIHSKFRVAHSFTIEAGSPIPFSPETVYFPRFLECLFPATPHPSLKHSTLYPSMRPPRTYCHSADKQWLGILYFPLKSLNLQKNGSPGLGSFVSVQVYTSVHLPTFSHYLPSSVESVVQ